jgi:hypothetical protein
LAIIRSEISRFEEYRLASKTLRRRELKLAASRSPVNNCCLMPDELYKAHELATSPTVGRKSLALEDEVIPHEQPRLSSRQQTTCAGGLWLLALLLCSLVMWAGFGWIVLRLLN